MLHDGHDSKYTNMYNLRKLSKVDLRLKSLEKNSIEEDFIKTSPLHESFMTTTVSVLLSSAIFLIRV